MGTPVKSIVDGPGCFHWIDPDHTPEKVYAFFWDILKGNRGGAIEPANLRIFTLYQVDISPCVWEHDPDAPGWKAQLGIQAVQCWLSLFTNGFNPRYYFHQTADFSQPPEYQLFTNFHQTPINTWGYGGYATIFWMEKVVELVEEFGWSHLTDLMLETFPVDHTEFVIKFCSKTLSQNIKMKFTP